MPNIKSILVMTIEVLKKQLNNIKSFSRLTLCGFGLGIVFVVLHIFLPAMTGWVMVPIALLSIIILHIQKTKLESIEKKYCNIGFWALIVIVTFLAVGWDVLPTP